MYQCRLFFTVSNCGSYSWVTAVTAATAATVLQLVAWIAMMELSIYTRICIEPVPVIAAGRETLRWHMTWKNENEARRAVSF